MGKVRARNCEHAYLRAAERCGWTRKQAEEMMRLASRKGLSYSNIEDKKLKEFVKQRQVATRRRIKYYLGYIFVFASTTTRCYTVYKYEGDESDTSE